MADNPTGGGLINLGDLSKPATVLIEKISDAVGGIAKPWQTVRVAKAEAKAELIRAQARFEVSEIEQRALLRMVREEGKKQENIENITAKAIPDLNPASKPENLEDDWITHFFDRCRLISDEDMQSLWAKMLAAEANSPGAFSKKTLDLVSKLDKTDAHLFTLFCSSVWHMEQRLVPIVYDSRHKVFFDLGINFDILTHLDDIGLITFGFGVQAFHSDPLPRTSIVSYYGRRITIQFPRDRDSLQYGEALLTQMGRELAPICGSTPSDPYYMSVLKHWAEDLRLCIYSPLE
jgi:Protein of unknown function (DUF2806)